MQLIVAPILILITALLGMGLAWLHGVYLVNRTAMFVGYYLAIFATPGIIYGCLVLILALALKRIGLSLCFKKLWLWLLIGLLIVYYPASGFVYALLFGLPDGI